MAKQPRNKFEVDLHNQFKKSKLEFGYEAAKLQYMIRGVYTPDWVIYKDKKRKKVKFIVEAKGHFRRENKRVLAAIRQQYPHLEIRMVLYRKNQQNIRWCDKHGIKYAIGRIPKDWLK